jgi:hypothetical protein
MFLTRCISVVPRLLAVLALACCIFLCRADSPSNNDSNPAVASALSAFDRTRSVEENSQKVIVAAELRRLLQIVASADTESLKSGNPDEFKRVEALQSRLCDLIDQVEKLETGGAMPGSTDLGTPDELPRAKQVKDAVTQCCNAMRHASAQRAASEAQASEKVRDDLQSAVLAAVKQGDVEEAKRITELKKNLGSPTTIVSMTQKAAAGGDVVAEGRKVDLLKLVDGKKDSVAGNWRLKDGVLQSDTPRYARMQFPYEPPVEYNYRVSFSRETGNDCIVLAVVLGDHQTCWAMGSLNNSACRFEGVNTKSQVGDPVVHGANCLALHGKYECVIKVRKTSLAISVNGKSVYEVHADNAMPKPLSKYIMLPVWKLPDVRALGIGSFSSTYKIYSIEVEEISGPGKVTR